MIRWPTFAEIKALHREGVASTQEIQRDLENKAMLDELKRLQGNGFLHGSVVEILTKLIERRT